MPRLSQCLQTAPSPRTTLISDVMLLAVQPEARIEEVTPTRKSRVSLATTLTALLSMGTEPVPARRCWGAGEGSCHKNPQADLAQLARNFKRFQKRPRKRSPGKLWVAGIAAGNWAGDRESGQVPLWGARENTADAAERLLQRHPKPFGPFRLIPAVGGREQKAGAAGTLCGWPGRRFCGNEIQLVKRLEEPIQQYGSRSNSAYEIVNVKSRVTLLSSQCTRLSMNHCL